MISGFNVDHNPHARNQPTRHVAMYTRPGIMMYYDTMYCGASRVNLILLAGRLNEQQ